MPKIDPAKVIVRRGTRYPAPYDRPCQGREVAFLSDAAGLTQLGVNLLRLDPGAWSSQRHWHTHEDEFVYVLEGEVVLVTGAGEDVLRAGDSAGFRMGDDDGHHLQNRSGTVAVVLTAGGRDPRDMCDYNDIDMVMPASRYNAPPTWTRKDGSAF